MLYWLRTIMLLPILGIQALAARRRALILPEPPGERSGEAGVGPPLRLLVCGDSAAAGVGADHQHRALLGQLVSELRGHYTVCWRLAARSGATTRSTLSHLGNLPPWPVDIATTSLGVNDVTSGVSLREWLRQQAALRNMLRQRFHARLIVISGLPPVHLFPGLPQPLRWHLGARAREFDAALAQAVAAEPDCAFVALNVTDDVSAMAPDGFHPGPQIYTLWAGLVAQRVLESLPSTRLAQ